MNRFTEALGKRTANERALLWSSVAGVALAIFTTPSHLLSRADWPLRTGTGFVLAVLSLAFAALSSWGLREKKSSAATSQRTELATATAAQERVTHRLFMAWLVWVPVIVGGSGLVLAFASLWAPWPALQSAHHVVSVTTLVILFPVRLFAREHTLVDGRLRLSVNLVLLGVLLFVALSAASPFKTDPDATWTELLFMRSVLDCAFVAACSAVMANVFVGLVLAGSSRRLRNPSELTAPPLKPVDARPLAIALSGGGLRAMTVALGVLEQLEAQQVLQRTRFISSVSGGGWALGAALHAWVSGKSVADNVSAVRKSRDYLSLRAGWRAMVQPLLHTVVGTVLVLVCLACAGLALLCMLMYLDALREEPSRTAAPLGRNFVVWITELGDGLNILGPAVNETPRWLAAARGVLSLLLALVACTSFVAATLVMLQQVRVPRVAQPPFDRRITSLSDLPRALSMVALSMGATCLLLGGALFSPHLFLWMVLVAVVAAVISQTLDWRAARASVIAGVVTTVISFLFAERTPIGTALDAVDEAWRGAVARITISLGDSAKSLAETMEWTNGQQLALQVMAASIGVAFFLASWVLSLERLGLSLYWRDRLSAAFWPDNTLTWERITDLGSRHPMPIFNAALNVPRDEGGTQSFVFRPDAWGPLGATTAAPPECAPADALAISSAALNSQGGSTLPAALRGLLSVVPLKLGRWLRAPSTDPTDWSPPTIEYLLLEALGDNTRNLPWLFVSDGGHYDNLGLIPLLDEADVKTIVCLDAAADPRYQFGDFATTALLARDRGWSLELPLDALCPPDEPGMSRLRTLNVHFVRGTAKHKDHGEKTLLFCKSAVVSGLNAASWAYARANEDFPQETTGDQLFDAQQFDAYLDVGRCIGRAVAGALNENTPAVDQNATPAMNDPP